MCGNEDPGTLLEFCAEGVTHVAAAIASGARRIELCDNLAVGGTSPSPGVIAAAAEIAHDGNASVFCMVRPRGGDFVYDELELRSMKADARCAVELGADGIVFGCLEPLDPEAHAASRAEDIASGALPGTSYLGGYRIDRQGCTVLCDLVRKLADARGRMVDITFHMAFDSLSPLEQRAAIDILVELGVTRILTHGGPAATPIEGNLERLRKAIAYAGGRLCILPGGGITYDNAAKVARLLGVAELHGTRIVDLSTRTAPRS